MVRTEMPGGVLTENFLSVAWRLCAIAHPKGSDTGDQAACPRPTQWSGQSLWGRGEGLLLPLQAIDRPADVAQINSKGCLHLRGHLELAIQRYG